MKSSNVANANSTVSLISPTGLIAALALGAPLAADDTDSFNKWSKNNMGIQLSVMQPIGELADFASTGFGASFYAEKVWSNSWALRGRLEGLILGNKITTTNEYWSGGSTGIIDPSFYMIVDSKITQVGLMADVIYYSGLGNLPYLFAGLGVFNRSNGGSVEYTHSQVGHDGNLIYHKADWSDIDSDAVHTNVAISLGTGWNFHKNLGLELKATTSGSMTWVQASLLYRF